MKDKVINDLLKKISDLEFEVERLEKVINEQRLENKLTHKELYKVWEERDVLYRRIYKAVDNLETPYFRECEQQCKDVIDILKGDDKE